LLHLRLHQGGPGAGPSARLEVHELPHEIARRPAGDARYRSQPPQVRAVAVGAGNAAVRRVRHQHTAFREAADRDVDGKVRLGVAHLKLFQIVRHLDDAIAQRLGAAVRIFRVYQAGDDRLRDSFGLDNLEDRSEFQRRKISGRRLDLLIGDRLADLCHVVDGLPLRSRKHAGAAFEVGHLLHDVGCRQAGDGRIFRSAGPLGAMAGPARPHLGLPSVQHDVRQGRVMIWVPVRREKQIARMLHRKRLRTVRDVVGILVGRLAREIGIPEGGP